jgi:hypothetical protein
MGGFSVTTKLRKMSTLNDMKWPQHLPQNFGCTEGGLSPEGTWKNPPPKIKALKKKKNKDFLI